MKNTSKEFISLEEIEKLKKEVEALRIIFQNSYEGIVMVDSQGNITMINDTYGEFLGIDAKDAIGKPVTDIIENTRLHIVIKTGKVEREEIQQINGNDAITSRIPIFSEGNITGAIGIVNYKSIQEFKSLHENLKKAKIEIENYKKRLISVQGNYYALDNIIGNSVYMLRLKETLKKISNTTSTVLITGESGTGKEVLANAIHEISDRRTNPFIKINCAAIPENILESELFGYEEGTFTGALKGGKIGRFEMAEGGTLFLDEIGDMSFDMQSKILRTLQEKEITKVGGGTPKRIDIRIIAATNQNLYEKMKSGEFREDLFYRLNVIPLELPPLRERKEDIVELCNFFLEHYNERFGLYINKIDDEAMKYICNYSWPGNVRELKNVIERAYNLAEKNIISKKHLPDRVIDAKKETHIGKLNTILDEVEKEMILETLKNYKGNKTKSAKALGINRSGLYQKLKKHNI